MIKGMNKLSRDEINKLVASLAGDAEIITMSGDGTLLNPASYSDNLDNALSAARRISDKTGYTFVLTFDGKLSEWTASFGDYRDCAEYKGSNPAYCVCISILEFYGKV